MVFTSGIILIFAHSVLSFQHSFYIQIVTMISAEELSSTLGSKSEIENFEKLIKKADLTSKRNSEYKTNTISNENQNDREIRSE